MKVKPDLVIFPVVTKFRSKSNKIFVGEKYAVLPKLPKKRKIKNINNIMISMGGSDPRKITLKTLLYIPILHIVIFTIVAHTAYRLRTPDSSSGVSDQQSVGSSPGCDTCVL